MEYFNPLYNIRVDKEPNGIYDLIFTKQDGHEIPMKLHVDGESKYNVEYRDEDGNKQIEENTVIKEAKMQDNSLPEYYWVDLNEGSYVKFPNKVMPYEINNEAGLLIKIDSTIETTDAEIDEEKSSESMIDNVNVDADSFINAFNKKKYICYTKC